MARVRSNTGKADDSVVKLRPVIPADIPPGLRQSKNFVVEIDGMPGRYICSGALKARLGTDDVEHAMTRRRPLHTLFTPRQLRLLTARLPRHVNVDDLTVFGLVDARRRTVVPAGYGRTLLAERWTFPDHTRILELSTRCTPDEALEVAAHTATVLRHHGVDLTGPQQTKTHATLDFFTEHP